MTLIDSHPAAMGIIPKDPAIAPSYWQWRSDNFEANGVFIREFGELYAEELVSEIVSASSGADTAAAVNKYRRILENYFTERWKHHTLPPSDEDEALRDFQSAM